MKRLFFLLLIILPTFIFAQKAKIEFTKTSHQFGVIPERGGKVVYDFIFKNTGKSPLVLTNVRTGCGCAVPEWSKKPVAPGANGTIRVYFDPRNRPGNFVKSLAVNSNASNNVVTLTIRGKVQHQPAGPYEGYDYSIGEVKFTQLKADLDDIMNTQQIEHKIQMIHSGKEPAKITVSNTSPHIKAIITPNTLKHGEKGEIIFTYNAGLKNDWGYVSDKINININDTIQGVFTFTANINEDFDFYEGNYDKAPAIQLPNETANLKNLPSNSKTTHTFFIQNNGKSDLIFRKVKGSEEDVHIHLGKHSIKPGKKIKVSVTFNTPAKGQITKLIQFTTNDPENPVTLYKINGQIK